MQTTATGTKRINTGRVWMAGLALVIALAAAAYGGYALDSRSEGGIDVERLPAVRDMTTLSLDQNGADIVPAPSRPMPDITGLALDGNGADIAPARTTRGIDVTTLALDGNGADVFEVPARSGPDITGLKLDRDGADIP
jgi:hypothetical protein